jgi:hypothetical protein
MGASTSHNTMGLHGLLQGEGFIIIIIIVQCLWSAIPLWRQMYTVDGTWPLYVTCVICHFWTPSCNVLGYWTYHLICYTCLFTTPLVVTTISVYDELWSSDVVSRSGPLISSLFCLLSVCSWMPTANCSWLSKPTLLSRASRASDRTPCPRVLFVFGAALANV